MEPESSSPVRNCAEPALFGRDKPSKRSVNVKDWNAVLKRFSGKQQGRRVKHESGEGEMERHDILTANTFSTSSDRLNAQP